MSEKTKYIVITDIGSTATKAILLEVSSGKALLKAVASHPTTVELPQNDVCFGIKQACVALEQKAKVSLLLPNTEANDPVFTEGVSYLSSSSAGGGLQILVIGLTLFDSASSAKRAAYGAGGVILDTFAIDDKRQAAQQMLAMRALHPDMILLSGGTDGGAISGVLKMAEVLRVAKPLPKYETETPIPTLYAGNNKAAALVEKMIGKEFDLHILPNLRPQMDVENLPPTQEAIRDLFMENVMERAPGYTKVKKITSQAIIPTPLGVLNTLSLISQEESHNIFAFDVGGATTDVFSLINGHLQRTVSANLGMSYSALNVFKEAGAHSFMARLPQNCSEESVRNYIGNKCLNPTLNPQTPIERMIEQALATEAIRLALIRHHEMHFNKEKLGFLERVINKDLDGFDFKFNYSVHEKKYQFQHSDIDLIIASGGIFAHLENPLDAAKIIIDAVKPKGVTEIRLDYDFISPHLGVLSETEASFAASLIKQGSLKTIAWHIAPIFLKAKGHFSYILDGKETQLLPNSLVILPKGEKEISFKLGAAVNLGKFKASQSLKTTAPVILDSRITNHSAAQKTIEDESIFISDQIPEPILADQKTYTREVKLPYRGETLVDVSQTVQPTDLVAINRFNPPRLFIVDTMSKFGVLSPELIRSSLSIKQHDLVDFDEQIAHLPDNKSWPIYLRKSLKVISPVRGKVEFIDFHTGLLVLSEIQDYSGKPVTVDLVASLGVKAKQVGRYLKKIEGDFVYKGDPLASRKEAGTQGQGFRFVKAPQTGTITQIDKTAGTLTIQYKTSPIDFEAQVYGKVISTKPEESVSLSYQAMRLEASLGLGKDCSGSLVSLENPEQIELLELSDKLVICSFTPKLELLKSLASKRINGLICYNIDEHTLCTFIQNELGVINTGNEVLAFSILILKGFGKENMPHIMWQKLCTLAGKHAYLAPHSRIRAGVVRPFLDIQN